MNGWVVPWLGVRDDRWRERDENQLPSLSILFVSFSLSGSELYQANNHLLRAVFELADSQKRRNIEYMTKNKVY